MAESGLGALHGQRDAKHAYSALITGVDHNVGRVLQTLEELELRDNTLVIFTADQGWNAGHHGVWGKGNGTVPFNLYEESIAGAADLEPSGAHPRRADARPDGFVLRLLPHHPRLPGHPRATDPRRAGRSYAGFLRGENPPLAEPAVSSSTP